MASVVVAAGESYEVAARRELSEELGIEVADFHHPARVASPTSRSLIARYLAVHDGPFTTDGEIARFDG